MVRLLRHADGRRLRADACARPAALWAHFARMMDEDGRYGGWRLVCGGWRFRSGDASVRSGRARLLGPHSRRA